MILGFAFILGIVSGLRTFTSPAAVMLRAGGVAGIVLAICAAGEYVVDALPQTPSRTRPVGVAARLISGAFVGWTIAVPAGSAVAGAIAGVIGAVIGTFGGHAARIAAIARIGALPAAFIEDLVAIALAALIVTR
jgi:uncharacterized membrane protein